jgi:hypothetical protein
MLEKNYSRRNIMAIHGNVKKDLCGKRFGRLIVTDKYEQRKRKNRKSSRTRWLCKCDCGNEKWIFRSLLLSGNTTSCGCYQIESHQVEYGRASANRVLRRYKNAAKRRNRSFNLSFSDFLSFTQTPCYYCGIDPSTIQKAEGNNGDFIYNGIDRVDNSIGYEINNCVPCCTICNQAKHILSQEDFINWVKKIYNNLLKKRKV